MEYLVDRYDKDNKLGPTTEADKWTLKQYMYFQMSGQVSQARAIRLPLR